MKRVKVIFIFVVVVSLMTILFTGCSKKEISDKSKGKIKVLTSVYPMYDFAKKIGGDKVEIKNMVPAGVEPHDWEPSPSDITDLQKANLFIYNGAGMEHWVKNVLSTNQNDKLVSLEASKGIKLRNASIKDDKDNNIKSDASKSAGYDPHVWTSPKNAKIELKNIEQSLIKVDPKDKKYFELNFEKYTNKFDKLDKEYRETLSKMPNKNVVVSHEAFGYLCDEYGLKQVGIVGLSPDSEPDPARMSQVIKFVKDNHVKVIFFEELVSPKVAKTIANATKAKTDVLNPVEGLSDKEMKNGKDYFSVMYKNLDALKNALK